MFSKNYTWLYAICVVVLTLFFQYLLYGDILFNPNQYMLCNSADGLQIYFNYAYHVKYGSGVFFSNQLYPYKELMFMTDAQSTLTLLVKYWHQHVFEIDKYIVGIFNAIILYSIPLCSFFLFLVFKKCRIHTLIAIIASLFFCFLSPQLFRVYAHFGMAYPFYIPMLIYFLLQFISTKKAIWWWGVFFTVLFWGFNNVHMGLMGGGFIMLCGIIFYFQSKQKIKFKILPAFAGFLPLLIIFSTLHLLDPFPDREAIPWGFLTFYSQIESVFLPARGTVLDFWNWVFNNNIQPHQPEGEAYIGTATIILLFLLISRLIYKTYKKRKTIINSEIRLLHIVGFIFLIYAMAIPFVWVGGMEWVEKIPFLNQFRCPGRFSWVFYYTTCILCTYYFHLLFMVWKKKKSIVKIVFLCLISCVFIFLDIKDFQPLWDIKRLYNENYFIEKNYLFKDTKKQFQLDTLHFQAIVGMPNMNAWSSFHVNDEPYFTVQYSNRLSYETGIPLLSAKLSRISSQRIFEASQLFANTLIPRKLFDTISTKPLLLVVDNNTTFNEYETHLINSSTFIFKNKDVSFYRFSKQNWSDTAQQIALKKWEIVFANNNSNYFSKDTKHVIAKYFDASVRGNRSNSKVLLDTCMASIDTNTFFELSLWINVNSTLYGMPCYEVILYGEHEHITYKERFCFSKFCDYHDGKLRSNCKLFFKNETKRIKITLDKTHQTLEQLLLRPIHTEVFQRKDSLKLYNNFFINK